MLGYVIINIVAVATMLFISIYDDTTKEIIRKK